VFTIESVGMVLRYSCCIFSSLALQGAGRIRTSHSSKLSETAAQFFELEAVWSILQFYLKSSCGF